MTDEQPIKTDPKDFVLEVTNAPEKPIDKNEVELVEKNDKKNRLLKALLYLSEHWDFQYNEMSTKIEFKKKDEKIFRILDNMEYENIRMDMKFNDIFISENDYRGLLNSERLVTKVNPLKDYIFALPKWDEETDYIAQILDNLIFVDENKRPEYIEYFKRWFVAMLCGLIDDRIRIESINHTCLVLVGAQGQGKTKFFTDLIPEHFRSEYTYTGNFQMENKDHVLMLATKLLVNLDELAALNKSELEMVKSRMTQTHVSLRKAYDKIDINLKRRASFCGTTNNDEVLRDVTGSRRFLMLSVSQIKSDKPINIAGAWSQALSLYKAGFKYWFSGDDIAMVENNNEFYTSKNLEEELIIRHFALPIGVAPNYMSATDIAMRLSEIYNRLNINQSVIRTVGITLKKLGYKKIQKRVNGQPTWVWEVNYLGGEVKSSAIKDMSDKTLPVKEEVKPLDF